MKKLLRTSIVAMAAAVLSMTLFSCGPDEPDTPNGGGSGGGEGTTTVAVTGVTLDKSTLSLVEGGSETLTATVAPSNATNKAVSWKTSDSGVATVDSNGKVTAVKAGSATITVTTTDGSKTATCSVTVTAKVVSVTEVTLDKGELELTAGETASLTATVKPDDATDKAVEWSSSAEEVAKVDATGKVTAVGAGTATITVKTKDGEKTATCVVKVNPAVIPVESVAVDPETVEITEGDMFQLKASVTPEEANQEVEWISEDDQVAAVDETGLVTAVKPGEVTITVKTKDGEKTATCVITVIPKVIPIEGVEIEPETLEVMEGGTCQLKATVYPADADQEVEWASQNSQVLTVDETGFVTALKPGMARVIARSKNNTDIQGYCDVTVVQDVSLKGISLDASMASISLGETRTLTVIYTPSYAANQKVTWTSSDPMVASVTDGKVQGLQDGTTTITATSEEGDFTAECVVTVTKAKGPFVYSVRSWNMLIDGEPDPLDGAYNGQITDDGDHYYNNDYYYTYRIDHDGKDLYSVERYSYRDWLCVNRRPVVNLTSFESYSWRIPEDLRGFSARNGVFGLLGRIGSYNFDIIRATVEGDMKVVKVHTPASIINSVSIATGADGTINAVVSLRDTFWDDCLYWYKISPDGEVTETLVEKTNTYIPRISISDKGDVYIFTSYQNGNKQNGRLYKNGVFAMDIDEVEINFQGSLFCSGDHVYTAITDETKKELRVHKDGETVLTLGKGIGGILGYYTNRLWVTSNGDIYVTWADVEGTQYLTKNDKVLFTATSDVFWNFCVVE